MGFSDNDINIATFLEWNFKDEKSIHFPNGTFVDDKGVGHGTLNFSSDWNLIIHVLAKIKESYNESNLFVKKANDVLLSLDKKQAYKFIADYCGWFVWKNNIILRK